MRVTELIEIIIKAIQELDLLDDIFYYLTKEMETYETKKNVAKTIGTVIGVAGTGLSVAGAFFTGGLTLFASGAAASVGGAAVNLVTDWVDGKECREFNAKIRTQTENYNGIANELTEKIDEISKTVERLVAERPDLDHARALFATLCTSNSPHLQNIILSVDVVKLTNALRINGSVLKTSGKMFARGAAVLGVVVSAFEVGSVVVNWFSDHQTVKAAKKIRGELQQAQTGLKDLKKKLLDVEVEILNGKFGGYNKLYRNKPWNLYPAPNFSQLCQFSSNFDVSYHFGIRRQNQ
jgi:hypothetical protein